MKYPDACPTWLEAFLNGEIPAAVEATPPQLHEPLRAYLLEMRTKHKRAYRTLEMHGRSLIHFFAWLENRVPQTAVDTIWTDHVAIYMAEFQVDGHVQGRNTRREGHRKTVRTMSSKAGILRSFFAWAEGQRLCRTNPVADLRIDWGPREAHPLPELQVAELLQAWTNPATHPRTAVVGLLCLVYGLTTSQIATLPLSALDLDKRALYGLEFPAPIPEWLHPVLKRYLQWRQALLHGRPSDRLVVTRLLHNNPPNRCFFVQILKPYGVSISRLRATALAETLQHGHLKLLTVFGMTSEGMRRYHDLARLVQNTRRVDPKPNLW